MLLESDCTLASKHFPEVLSHADVKLSMGSDGLQVRDRKLADEDSDSTPWVVVNLTS